MNFIPNSFINSETFPKFTWSCDVADDTHSQMVYCKLGKLADDWFAAGSSETSRRDGPSPLGCCGCCCCCWFSCRGRPCCALLLSSTSLCSFYSLFYGQIITAAIQFWDKSYFKRFHFYTLVSDNHSISRIPTHPPDFIAPRHFRSWKIWFLYQNSRYLPIFVEFSLITKSIMNRFRNGLHSRIALA